MIHSDLPQEVATRNRRAVRLGTKLDRNLLSYVAAASAAGVSVLAGAPAAEANVVYTPANTQVGSTLLLDLNHDGINDFKLVLAHSSHCEGLCTGTGFHHDTAFTSQNGKLAVYGLSNNQVWGQGAYASALLRGSRIGSNGKFPGGNKMVTANDINSYTWDLGVAGPWVGAPFGPSTIKNHFLGFKFSINGQTHFGWARFNVTILKAAVIQATLTGYAYETQANTPITTSSLTVAQNRTGEEEILPVEPSRASLGALARGADGLVIWRKEESGS